MVLLDTGTPGTSREIYSEDADGETRARNPWITNPVLWPLRLDGETRTRNHWITNPVLQPLSYTLYFPDEKSITVEK